MRFKYRWTEGSIPQTPFPVWKDGFNTPLAVLLTQKTSTMIDLSIFGVVNHFEAQAKCFAVDQVLGVAEYKPFAYVYRVSDEYTNPDGSPLVQVMFLEEHNGQYQSVWATLAPGLPLLCKPGQKLSVKAGVDVPGLFLWAPEDGAQLTTYRKTESCPAEYADKQPRLSLVLSDKGNDLLVKSAALATPASVPSDAMPF